MRHLICAECSKGKTEGTRLAYAARFPDPAEYERVTFGIASKPKREQRIMRINGEPHQLPPDHYTCDDCNAPIHPGDKCCAWTVWVGRTTEPELWELDFLIPADLGT